MDKVRENLVFGNGERFATLVDDTGVPDFWVTLFVTAELRPRPRTQNAILNTLQSIAHFKLWEQVVQRDILSEFSDEKFLSDRDVRDLRGHCALETNSVRKSLEIEARSKVIKFNRAKSSQVDRVRRVSKYHQYNRMGHIAKFRFFVTSCGFGLIQQAAHGAANQVDHRDEVGLVPVAARA